MECRLLNHNIRYRPAQKLMLLSTVASFPVGFTRYMNPVRHTPHKEILASTLKSYALYNTCMHSLTTQNYGQKERCSLWKRRQRHEVQWSELVVCPRDALYRCSAEISQKCTARSMVASRNQRTYDLSAALGRALLQLPILRENHCQSLPSHADRHRNFDLSQRKLVLCRWKRCLRLGLSWICAGRYRML